MRLLITGGRRPGRIEFDPSGSASVVDNLQVHWRSESAFILQSGDIKTLRETA